MAVINFVDNHIQLEKAPGRPRKLTGTRFATILGLNAWETPFKCWCDITGAFRVPFEENQYTNAGKVIEPKVIAYLNKTYFLDLRTPTDVYGADYFNKTRGDFFPNDDIFGGMWDALGDDFPVEIKTTKRAEDWTEDIPIYYKLQAALYAWLLGFDRVILTVSFLSEKDYTAPEKYKPSYKNTKTYDFYLSEDFPHFEHDYILPARRFWTEFVLTGISPAFDEKKDSDILKELRKNTVEPDDEEIKSLLDEADALTVSIENHNAQIQSKVDRLDEIKGQLKPFMQKQFRTGDKKVEIKSDRFVWTLTKTNRADVDRDAMRAAGIYDNYLKSSVSYALKSTYIN